MNNGKKVGLGVGIAAAAAAAAAGAYYLYGPSGSKNRKKIKGWMLKARGEVIERMEKLKDVSKEEYQEIVDSVVQGYKKAQNASPAELAALATELKGHWNSISKGVKGTAKTVRRPRKTAKKAISRTTPKTTRKRKK
jgi:uncharacterized protein YfkK (UPF0435 family)